MDMLRKEPKQHPAQRSNVPADATWGLTIRDLEREDLPVLLEFCQAHASLEQCPFDPLGKTGRWAQFLFDARSGIHCWLLEYAGQPVGYSTFMRQFSTWDADYYLYLDCLYLQAGFRGRGFGSQVMQSLKDYAQLHHYPAIQWQTPTFNREAIIFYQRLGATSKSKERFFWATDEALPISR